MKKIVFCVLAVCSLNLFAADCKSQFEELENAYSKYSIAVNDITKGAFHINKYIVSISEDLYSQVGGRVSLASANTVSNAASSFRNELVELESNIYYKNREVKGNLSDLKDCLDLNYQNQK
ncbi:MAG: hypothetical protein ACOYL6_16200 [Bacteriovoracaceae bacterium]